MRLRFLVLAALATATSCKSAHGTSGLAGETPEASASPAAAAPAGGGVFAGFPRTVLTADGRVASVQPQNGVPRHVIMAPPADAVSDDSYYVIFWSYQRGNNVSLPSKKLSHTFASFLHVAPTDSGPRVVTTPYWNWKQADQDRDQLGADTDLAASHASFTISWMPVSGNVNSNVFAAPEPGETTSLDYEIKRGARPAQGLLIGEPRAFAWGPFRINAELFQRAEAQRDFLRAGQVGYKAARRDSARDSDYVPAGSPFPKPVFLNCLAAAGDVAPNGGARVYGDSGVAGTRDLVVHFMEQQSFLSSGANPTLTDRHDWVATQLALDQYSDLYPQGIELEDVGR